MFKGTSKQPDKKKGKSKKEGGSTWYYEDDDSLSLDIPTINKFARLKVTAPLNKSSLPKTIKDLEELKQAF